MAPFDAATQSHDHPACQVRRPHPGLRAGNLIERLSMALLTALLLAFCASPALAQATAFVGVNVIPMDTQRVLEDYTVVVDRGVIASLGPRAEVDVPDGAVVIDGAGRYLIPGLTDTHVHLTLSERELLSLLAHGVTTVFHLGGRTSQADATLELRNRIAAGEIAGPTIFATPAVLDGDPPAASREFSYQLSTPAEARERVRWIAGQGFDFVKLYNNLTPEVVDAILEEAELVDLPVFGHIPRTYAATEFVTRGADVVVHVEEFFFTHFQGPRSTKDMDRNYRPDLLRIGPLVRLVKEHEVAVTPNLSFTFTNLLQWDDLEAILNDPEMRYLPEDLADQWRRSNVHGRPDLENFMLRESIKYSLSQELTRALHEAGVLLLLGTDAPYSAGLFPGKSAHRELTELVKAGLSNFEALATATRNPGVFGATHFEARRPFGIIAEGYQADLVFLSANPLERIQSAGKIEGIMVRGHWHSRDELDRRRGE